MLGEITNPIQDKRKSPRLSINSTAIIDDCSCSVTNLSLDGLQIENFSHKAEVGDFFSSKLTLEFYKIDKQEITISIHALLQVVWVHFSDRKIGCRIVKISDFESDLLTKFIQKMLVGELKISQPLPREKSSSTSSATWSQNSSIFLDFHQSPKRKNLKLIIFSVLYLTIGIVLSYYTLRSIYSSLANIQITDAIVSKPLGPVLSPVEPILSQEQGIIGQMFVYEGISVTPGQPLFTTRHDPLIDLDLLDKATAREVNNIDALIRDAKGNIDSLDLKIKLSQIKLSSIQGDIEERETLRDQESKKLEFYQSISQTKLDSYHSKEQWLTLQAETAKSRRQRLIKLFQQGAVSQEFVDSATTRLADIEAQLQDAKREYQIAKTGIISVQKGDFYDERSLVSDLATLTAKVHSLRKNLELAKKEKFFLEQSLNQQKQRVQSLQEQKEKLQTREQQRQEIRNQHPLYDESKSRKKNLEYAVYKAPFRGVVVKILKVTASSVKPKETVLILQRELEPPKIDAYVTPAQANQVQLGSEASVQIPALNKEYSMRIVKIDRTPKALEQAQEEYQFKGLQDKTVYIQLSIDNLSQEDNSRLTTVKGMPALVKIPKTSTTFDSFLFWLK
jgi:multidrug efflux pump subunit AcrA (membrane-fusion protein)